MIRKLILPVLVLVLLGAASAWIMSNPPQAKRRPPQKAPQLTVETMRIAPQAFSITLDSYGRIRPRTQSTLLPQVAGEIVWISAKFRTGSFFEKGEALLKIDPRDYEAQVASARASLASARQKLAEEQAQAEQAAQDWRRLGNRAAAPALVQRKPQLAAARASVESARAALKIAELNLERTEIRAPYTARVLNKNVDIGQLVSTGTTLATLYAVDYVEVRLPLQNRDLKYIDLPERYRFDDNQPVAEPDVTITSELVRTEHWQGRVVLTEGAIDDSSRQLYVVAQIDDPYGKAAAGRVPLKVGQYVTARIQGRTVQDALVIPNRAIYQGSYVYKVVDGVLQRSDVSIDWQNGSHAVIGNGLQSGDQLVITPLGQVVSGTPVKQAGEQAAPGREKAEPGQQKGKPEQTRTAASGEDGV
ncbi:MAG: efflux RND transporter periplasmic adaptor subunit [Marinobacterium sp.]|nr:efflux RND transporter periplasmic adaptor subunit [Marinobacterium sp.]